MFSPCAKNSASPSMRLGSMASAYSARWRWSGTSTMIRSASSQASRGVVTRSPSLTALSRLREPDPDVDPGVTQGQRVRVSLAAVPEDGDVPALDDAEVGTVVIENVCHCLPFAYRLFILSHGLASATGPSQPRAYLTHGPPPGSPAHPEFWPPAAAGHGAAPAPLRSATRSTGRSARSVIDRPPRPRATMPDWTSSLIPNGSSTLIRASSLSRLPVASTVTASWATSTTLARNSVTVSSTRDLLSRSARTLISSSSRCTEAVGSSSTILSTLISLLSCLVTCSSG